MNSTFHSLFTDSRRTKCLDLLNQQIFCPYFISNGTLLLFGKQQELRAWSLMEIMKLFNDQNMTEASLYFSCTHHNE